MKNSFDGRQSSISDWLQTFQKYLVSQFSKLGYKIELEFIKDKVSGSYEIHLNNKNVEQNIRSKKVSELVSEISKISIIRKKLVQMQRTIGNKKGIVMEGRDIGTVVFPRAELKIFMKADLDIRAKRRFNEFDGI